MSAWVEEYINSVKNTALDAVDDLKTASLNYFDIFWSDKTAGFDVATPIAFSWKPPVLPEVSDFSQASEYKDFDADRHNTYTWSSDIELEIRSAISSVLTTGGYTINQAFQDAVYNQDLERKLQALDDALLKVSAGFGGRGFTNVSHVLTGPRNELIQKYQFDRETASRKIVELMEEHYRQNTLSAIKDGISNEQINMDFTNKYDNLFIEMKKAAIDLYIKSIQAEVASYEAFVKGVISKAEVAKAEASYYATAGGILVEKYKADISQESAKKQINLQTAQSNASNTLTAISGYANAAGKIIASAGNTAIEFTSKKGT